MIRPISLPTAVDVDPDRRAPHPACVLVVWILSALIAVSGPAAQVSRTAEGSPEVGLTPEVGSEVLAKAVPQNPQREREWLVDAVAESRAWFASSPDVDATWVEEWPASRSEGTATRWRYVSLGGHGWRLCQSAVGEGLDRFNDTGGNNRDEAWMLSPAELLTTTRQRVEAESGAGKGIAVRRRNALFTLGYFWWHGVQHAAVIPDLTVADAESSTGSTSVVEAVAPSGTRATFSITETASMGLHVSRLAFLAGAKASAIPGVSWRFSAPRRSAAVRRVVMSEVEELTPAGTLYRRLRLESLERPDPALVSEMASTPVPGGHDAVRGAVLAVRIVDERSGTTEEFGRLNGELVRMARVPHVTGATEFDRWLRVIGWVLGGAALLGVWMLRGRGRAA